MKNKLGIYEKEKNKKYTIDLRSIKRGRVVFEGTYSQAKKQRLLLLNKYNFNDVIIEQNDPVYIAKAIELFHIRQKERFTDGFVGKGELGNKKLHLQRLAQTEINGKPTHRFALRDMSFDLLDTVLRRQIIANQGNSKLASTTVHRTFTTIKQFFKWCFNQGWIEINPAIQLECKRGKPAVGRRIKPNEMAVIISNVPASYRRQVKTAAYTGMRAGELVALTWENINFKEGYINITKARKTDGSIGGPKTEKGIREIKMLDELKLELKRWKIAQPFKQRHKNLVFPTRNGEMADHNNWRTRGLKVGCEGAGVEPIMWKDLRNFFASVLIFSEKINDKMTAAWMGHGSANFTYEQYARYYKDLKRDEEIINDAFELNGNNDINVGQG